MATTWQRWLKYGRAKLDSALKSGEQELDRREAALEAEAADKPWLRSEREAPTLDEVKARIDYEAKQAGSSTDAGAGRTSVGDTSGHDGFDFAEQQRQADERLASIRSELGLDPTAEHGDDPDP